MRATHPDHGGLNAHFGHAFRSQGGAVDRIRRRRQLCNEALPHAFRLLDAVPAIAKNAVLHLRNQHAALCAAGIQHGDQVVRALFQRETGRL